MVIENIQECVKKGVYLFLLEIYTQNLEKRSQFNIKNVIAGMTIFKHSNILNVYLRYSICYNDYTLSGNQDAENQFDEWIKFTTNLPACDVLVYAMCLFGKHNFDQLGRALPEDVQRDTAELDVNDTYKNRKRKQTEKRAERWAKQK